MKHILLIAQGFLFVQACGDMVKDSPGTFVLFSVSNATLIVCYGAMKKKEGMK
jgi:hypothetical protein